MYCPHCLLLKWFHGRVFLILLFFLHFHLYKCIQIQIPILIGGKIHSASTRTRMTTVLTCCEAKHNDWVFVLFLFSSLFTFIHYDFVWLLTIIIELKWNKKQILVIVEIYEIKWREKNISSGIFQPLCASGWRKFCSFFLLVLSYLRCETIFNSFLFSSAYVPASWIWSASRSLRYVHVRVVG